MNRLYVLVRQDLKYSSPAVQAGHAVAEFCLGSGRALKWGNHTLIYLGVKNLNELLKWCFKLGKKDVDFICFSEPDMDDEMTAIAALVDDGKIFRDLKLLE